MTVPLRRRKRAGMDEKLANLVADVFELSAKQVTEGLTAEKVESWDSMKHLQLVLALEQAYGVQLDTDEIPELRSVKDIIDSLRRHGVPAGPAR